MFRRILSFIRSILGVRPQLTIEDQLEAKAKFHPEKLDWRNSVVDLMKLRGMDSSIENRKRLAQQMGYPGPANGSAAMNVWLHRQLMKDIRR